MTSSYAQFQVKTSDFEVIGTNVHRDGNKNVAWNDAVEIRFKCKQSQMHTI